MNGDHVSSDTAKTNRFKHARCDQDFALCQVRLHHAQQRHALLVLRQSNLTQAFVSPRVSKARNETHLFESFASL